MPRALNCSPLHYRFTANLHSVPLDKENCRLHCCSERVLKAAWFLSLGRALAATILWFNLDCRAYPERRLLKSMHSFPLFSYICTGVCNFSLFGLLESYCYHQEKCSFSSWGSAKEGLILLLDTQIGLVTKLTFISISHL